MKVTYQTSSQRQHQQLFEQWLVANKIRFYRQSEMTSGLNHGVLLLGTCETPLEEFEHYAQLIAKITPLHPEFPLACRAAKDGHGLQIGNHLIGGPSLTLMAGPCAVESEAQIDQVAQHVAAAGAQFLRGGAFKARTSPYSFQGLGFEGLRFLAEAAKRHQLLSVCELLTINHLDYYLDHIDLIQVGSRNMHNFELLKALGQTAKPVLLKRGLSATYQEWLLAAEYILSHGNPNVILCERGIRSFEPMTRNTFDINAIAIMNELSHLPIIADPSHGTGRRDLVEKIALAAITAGASGVMVEVHEQPEQSLSDAAQAIDFHAFSHMVHAANALHHHFSMA